MDTTEAIAAALGRELEALAGDEVVREIVAPGPRSFLARFLAGLVL